MHSLDLSYLRRHEIAKLNKPNKSKNKTNDKATKVDASDKHPIKMDIQNNASDITKSNSIKSEPVKIVDPKAEKEDIQEQIKVEQERKRLAEIQLEITKLQDEQRTAQLNSKYNYDQRYQALEKQSKTDRAAHIWQWMKRILIVLFLLLMITLLALLLFRVYRWTVEAPLIKEVIRKVEVPVEKRIEVPVEKQIIPEECSQVRRNGKIYINCDGKIIDGTPTIGDAKINEIPELLN
ncbi:hypothetical protein K8B83_04885 [Shewanella inventionis]|uniref:Uncharacterized protein n=1 Tax=Shewanella inventionis TaxID=1738770 RepID=A0ABQ1IL00_9GAMM|nr:hypothetical protein [Shewanella inventionis]MCL1156491.1 hypothetical protein [Shewanella inventionis]UAL44185.1 hypothetical protein K8B83_04885 [Shewanella inventionis]GGB45955.1 hypothetical protein GCM10011607_02540 [Shewanella inventionis]